MNFCVLTDIHGQPMAADCLISGLVRAGDVQRFALNTLCGRTNLRGQALHRHLFEDGGMDAVACALRRQVKQDGPVAF